MGPRFPFGARIVRWRLVLGAGWFLSPLLSPPFSAFFPSLFFGFSLSLPLGLYVRISSRWSFLLVGRLFLSLPFSFILFCSVRSASFCLLLLNLVEVLSLSHLPLFSLLSFVVLVLLWVFFVSWLVPCFVSCSMTICPDLLAVVYAVINVAIFCPWYFFLFLLSVSLWV